MAVWNQRANDVFATALEQPVDHRQAYLEQACATDSDLRRRVEALLAAHAQPGSSLDRPLAGAQDGPTTAPSHDSGPPLPAAASVVQALRAALPCLQLREPDGEPLTDAGPAA